MSAWPHEWLPTSPGRRCPACHAATGRPILRGLPDRGLVEALERGEIDVFLGGCLVSDEDPTHQCRTCGRAFGARAR